MIIRTAIILSLCLFLLLATSTALAQPRKSWSPRVLSNEETLYLGFRLGHTDVQVRDHRSVPETNTPDGRITDLILGYRFTPHLAVEASMGGTLSSSSCNRQDRTENGRNIADYDCSDLNTETLQVGAVYITPGYKIRGIFQGGLIGYKTRENHWTKSVLLGSDGLLLSIIHEGYPDDLSFRKKVSGTPYLSAGMFYQLSRVTRIRAELSYYETTGVDNRIPDRHFTPILLGFVFKI